MKVEVSNYTRKYVIDRKKLRKLLNQVGQLANCGEGVVSLSFVGKKRIKNINKRFRDRDRPTNVISFTFMDDVAEEKILGDIVICPFVASLEAKRYGNDFIDYITFLLIHGFLHLLGYDHAEVKDKLIMEKEEERIFHSILIQNFIKEAEH